MARSSKKIFITGALLVGGAWFFYQQGWFLRSTPAPKTEPAGRAVGDPDAPSRNTPTVVSTSDPALDDEQGGVQFNPPTREETVEEIRKDPHGIPVSNMRLAEQMSDLMASADHSPEQAEKVFEQLKNCVEDHDDKIPEPVRVHCLFNAKVLAAKNPDFAERFRRLESSVPRLVQFLQDTGLDSD